VSNHSRAKKALGREGGGIEHHAFINVASKAFSGVRVYGVPDKPRENTSPDGKASSVQFLKFPFTDNQIAWFKKPDTQIIAGFDHTNCAHMTVLSESMKAVLADDFD